MQHAIFVYIDLLLSSSDVQSTFYWSSVSIDSTAYEAR